MEEPMPQISVPEDTFQRLCAELPFSTFLSTTL